MKQVILTIVLTVIIQAFSISQNVSKEEAQTVAKNFFFERINQYEPFKFEEVQIHNSFEIKEEGITSLYIYNLKPKGFVMVTGDKSCVPVPAYSLSGFYGDGNQPPQFKAWVKQYQDQIKFAIKNQITPLASTVVSWNKLMTNNPEELTVLKDEKEVTPMLLSTWDQGQFFNQMCPDDPAGPAGHCLTGCVATAMGQLCNYFRWPDYGTGSYTYQHPTYGTISANFEETRYRWNEMTNSVTEQNTAVAELLFHLGVSVDMDYGPSGSGMWNHKAAYSLRTFFKYAPETEYLYRDSTNLTWDSVVIAHLDQHIPMYYAGWSVPNLNGHAFIVDGYQTEDYFHFNWGWGGSYDGYFYLDELSPGGSNFNLAQELVINCYPDTLSYSYPYYCEGNDTLLSVNGTIDDGSCPRNNYLDNSNCSWLIDPQTEEDSVSSIILQFDRFNTESNNDILTVYDGGSTSDPVLGEFSGSTIPNTINSTSNKLLITFNTNETITAPGWFISYESVQPVWCSGLTFLTEPTDTFTDGSGSFNYKNGSTCMWSIAPDGAEQVSIHFLEFDTEEVNDEVSIYDAGSNELLASYSGTYDPGNLPDPVVSPSGEMVIAFSSNTTVTKQGWKAYYTITTDISENRNDAYDTRIFPNPANEAFSLEMNIHEVQDIYLQITNVNGQLVSSEIMGNCQGYVKKTIDLSKYENGIYFIEVTGQSGSSYSKIIKTD